jgi:ATP/ADP translocase
MQVTVQQLSDFFLWCSVINGALLIFWILIVGLMPDRVYQTQHYWFPLSRAEFDRIIYAFLGLFKIFFLFFNLTPYIALRIIA